MQTVGAQNGRAHVSQQGKHEPLILLAFEEKATAAQWPEIHSSIVIRAFGSLASESNAITSRGLPS